MIKYHPRVKYLVSREGFSNDSVMGRTRFEDAVFTVIDTETTGLSAFQGHRIVEIGAVRIRGMKIVEDEVFSTLVDPCREISQGSYRINRIDAYLLSGKPKIEEVLPDLIDFIDNSILVGHNIGFDLSFIFYSLERSGLPLFDNQVFDTKMLSRLLFGGSRCHSLRRIAKKTGVPLPDNLHRALTDAMLTARIFIKLLELLMHRGVNTIEELSSLLFQELNDRRF